MKPVAKWKYEDIVIPGVAINANGEMIVTHNLIKGTSYFYVLKYMDMSFLFNY